MKFKGFYITGNIGFGHCLIAREGLQCTRLYLGMDAVSLDDASMELSSGHQFNQDDPLLRDWLDRFELVFKNPERSWPEIPFVTRGTPFQHQVWDVLGRIPRGSTLTYQEVANAIGKPSAARAVGRACGANPLAILIPCHRVIKTSGLAGGYRWGLFIKQRLLAMEAR